MNDAALTTADMFRRLIRTTGPISLSQFMGESNARYYAGKDPIGTRGDFITAPEISQMFGELIGLWLADMWMRAGRRDPVYYVELGPGRGTLAKDALRSAKRYGLNMQPHFIEGSPALREIQRAAVPGVIHHDDFSTVPANGPLLVVGNEFFDALPVRQLVRAAEGWRERMVALEGDAFVFAAGSQPMDAAVPDGWRQAVQGAIIETCPGASAVMADIAARLKRQGGAGLFIDYGHADMRGGSTLQAVRNHQKVDPFSSPGEADLTAHVDFATLAQVAQASGARWLGTVTQGEWLKRLGIDMRTEALTRQAPHYKTALQQARHRLTADDQMGLLFKVMGLAAPVWSGGTGFSDS